MRAAIEGGLRVCLGAVLVVLTGTPSFALTSCDMTFDLDGWSAFYQASNGKGSVRCDNGQRAHVVLEGRGGGLTFGRSQIVDGIGHFSPLADIGEIFGNYANAEAHAGMGISSKAQVLTKGPVSLTLSGTGNGVDLGFAFGRFTLAPAGRYEGRRDPERRVDEDDPDAREPRDSRDDDRGEPVPPPPPPPDGY